MTQSAKVDVDRKLMWIESVDHQIESCICNIIWWIRRKTREAVGDAVRFAGCMFDIECIFLELYGPTIETTVFRRLGVQPTKRMMIGPDHKAFTVEVRSKFRDAPDESKTFFFDS